MSDKLTKRYQEEYDKANPRNAGRREKAELSFNEAKKYANDRGIELLKHTPAHYQVRGSNFIYDIWPGTQRYYPVKGDKLQIYLESITPANWLQLMVQAIVDYFAPSFQSMEVPQAKLDYINSFRTFGEQWKLDSIRGAKVDIYITKYLRRNDAKSKITTPFRCCTEGVEVYGRRDCKPLTANDIEALQALCKGQRNSVQGKAGDMEAVHSWTCDSSD